MLTVKYTGEGERTVGVSVVYPGELLSATPAMLAAWRAVHGDVFAVVGEAHVQVSEGSGAVVGEAHVPVSEGSGAVVGEAHVPVSEGSGAVVVDAGVGLVFGDVAEADAEAAKSKRGRGK